LGGQFDGATGDQDQDQPLADGGGGGEPGGQAQKMASWVDLAG
jgi:hypothetical protein